MKTTDYTPRHRWDDRLGLPHGTTERIVHGSPSWLQAQVGSLTTTAYWEDIAEQLHLSVDDIQSLADDFYSGDELDLDLIHYIRQQRLAGYKVALLSNDVRELKDKLSQLGIIDLFDPLIISAEIGVMKPAPSAYLAVVEKLNIPANQGVFIDDRLENVEGAHAVGLHAIHYTSDIDLVAALEPLLS
ncbi:MAG: HAD-IA family hydrolase [Chitinophagaceae bacterium]|nr:HAD-IA family hydrolase [Anaerolineae bacterium]